MFLLVIPHMLNYQDLSLKDDSFRYSGWFLLSGHKDLI